MNTKTTQVTNNENKFKSWNKNLELREALRELRTEYNANGWRKGYDYSLYLDKQEEIVIFLVENTTGFSIVSYEGNADGFAAWGKCISFEGNRVPLRVFLESVGYY